MAAYADQTAADAAIDAGIRNQTADDSITPTAVSDIASDLAATAFDQSEVSVSTYDALEAYAGSQSAISLTDSRYGGRFVKRSGSITDNGATLVNSTGLPGNHWERQWDGIHLQPEWFDIGGGKDHGGTDGNINHEADALRSAALLCDSIGAILTLQPRTYTIDRGIGLQGITCEGNGATIQRFASPKTALNGAILAGATTWTVDDTTGFRKGQRLAILDLDATNGGQGYQENGSTGANWDIMEIDSLTATTITVLQGPTSAMADNDEVVVVFNLFECNGAKVDNITFDGNLPNQPAGFTHDWRAGNSIQQNNDDNLVIRNCHFHDTPSECLYIRTGVVDSCTFKTLAGSVVHTTKAASEDGHLVISNCEWDDTNNEGDALMDHSEAAITFSARIKDLTIDRCRGTNMNEAIFGGFAGEHGRIQITNCEFKVAKNIVISRAPSTDVPWVQISNCRFESCGDLVLWSTNAWFTSTDVDDFFDWRISDCTFVNARIGIFGGQLVRIENCNQYYLETADFTGWTGWMNFDVEATTTVNRGAYLILEQCRQSTISGCRLYAPPLTNDSHDYVPHGIVLDHNNSSISSGGESFGAFQSNVIRDTVVHGFRMGVGTLNTLPSSGDNGKGDAQNKNQFAQVGWRYDNLTIAMPRILDDGTTGVDNSDGNDAYALMVGPGILATNCHIYGPITLSSGEAICIFAKGADFNNPTTADGADNMIGAIVRNNFIFNAAATTVDLRMGQDWTDVANSILYDNFLGNGTIHHAGSNVGYPVNAAAEVCVHEDSAGNETNRILDDTLFDDSDWTDEPVPYVRDLDEDNTTRGTSL